MSMPYKDWKKVGIKTFEAMLYGSGGSKIKKIKRAIYSQKLTHQDSVYIGLNLKKENGEILH